MEGLTLRTLLSKKAIRIAAVVLLLSFAYLIFISYKHSTLARLVVNVAPSDSVVKLDGKVIHHQTHYVKPGSHTLIASRVGFKDDSETVVGVKGKITNVYLLPEPETAAALQFLKNNPKIQTDREGIASQKVAATQTLLLSKYPIIKYLPITTRYYTINYGASVQHPNDPSSLAIYITVDPANRELAVDWIKYKGFDPNKLEIIYKNP